ncbi:MAG: zinc-binding dehydrogenase [Firmicutes bacterium]|nr:zinc-binding dehydrogenase [Bacillota bacterium]
MKGYKIKKGQGLVLENMPSDLEHDQIKIKVSRATVSNRDVVSYGQDEDSVVLGRQCVGMVTELGDDFLQKKSDAKGKGVFYGLQRGDRVVVSPYLACGECKNCLANKKSICNHLQVVGKDVDGSLRDFVIAKEKDVFVLPSQVTDEQAVFVEQVAISLAAFAQLSLQKGDHLTIVGGSVTGLVMAQLALYYQAIPILVDMDETALRLAQKLGVVYTVNQVAVEPKKKIFSITSGNMSDKLALIAASQIGASRAMSYLMRGGKMAIVDPGEEYRQELDSQSVAGLVVSKQVNLCGVSNGHDFMKTAINMLANKAIGVEQLISTVVDFDKVGGVLSDIAGAPHKYIKVLVKF